MIKFEKPEYKITESQESNHYGKFEIEPLERGFGTTIGNALRRVLLSSLPGSAVTAIKIDGVMHEFQKIEGVVEDVTTIVLAIKKLVVKNHTEDVKTLHLVASKEGPVTAGDIEANADIEIMNPDLVICNLVKGGKIDIEMTVNNGRGYVPASENKKLLDDVKVGVIAIDSSYSPIENVKYEVLKKFDLPISFSKDIIVVSMRVSKKFRIIGFREKEFFYIVWFDKNHTTC